MQLISSGKCGVNSALNLKPAFKLQVFHNKNFLQTLDAFISRWRQKNSTLFPFCMLCLRTRQEQNKMTLSQVLLTRNNVFSPCLEMKLRMLLCGDGRCFFSTDGLIFFAADSEMLKYFRFGHHPHLLVTVLSASPFHVY